MDKGKMVEELLEKSYQVVDFLPEQVPEGSAGQFFAVEKYYMNPERMKEFRRKFADILLKLNCYYNFSVCEAQGDVFTDNPDPEWLEGKVLGNADLCVLLPEEETLITLYRDDLYMTVYNACGSVLKRLEQLAEAEELFVR